jgi:modulator of FtsH protease HflC
MNDHPHAHDHGHHHGHDHGPRTQGGTRVLRLSIAGLLIVIAILAASLAVVPQGTALIVTRFGNPVRVEVAPGLLWRLPAPVERTLAVDLRLHTTATGLHDVGTKDALRIQIAVFAAWRVPAKADAILAHVRSVRGDADEAAGQVRSFLGSALETEASRFTLNELISTDVAQVRLSALEDALLKRLAEQVRTTYGVELVQVGIERLGLPKSTVDATVERMISERQTAAAQRKASGAQLATTIQQEAYRDSRITIAKAEEEASTVVAQARTEAAAIYSKAHAADPELYAFLRGLDSLEQIITNSTRIVLRTDAAPFKSLVDAPAPPISTAPSKAADQ